MSSNSAAKSMGSSNKRGRLEDDDGDGGVINSQPNTSKQQRSSSCNEGDSDNVRESQALQSILQSENTDISTFFASTWQTKPAVYRRKEQSEMNDRNDNLKEECPLALAVDMGWDGLASLLQRSRNRFANDSSTTVTGGAMGSPPGAGTTDPPLFFRDQTPVQPDEAEVAYNRNPFSAYLDGCSVVLNHADLLCPRLAALCLDLQKSFPHVYVNSYLTPPGAQAVPAHADDRDVLVIQILGEKMWTVYGNVPIAHPYPPEQVGKGNLDVPDTVLNGPTVIDTTLRQGDVLYMPRGYVHEARTESTQPSFHATVAIASHDWTLAGNVSELVSRTLTSVPEFRVAVDRSIGRAAAATTTSDQNGHLSSLQTQIDHALDIIREKVSAQQIASQLSIKYRRQNDLSCAARTELIREETTETVNMPSNTCNDGKVEVQVVGPEASKRVFVGTVVRASTDEERASVKPPQRPANAGPSDRGLTVREETCLPLMTVVQRLKHDPNLKVKVSDLLSLIRDDTETASLGMVCALSILSFVRCCVELGAVAIVS